MCDYLRGVPGIGFLRHALGALAGIDHEIVVLTIARPRSLWNVAGLDKFPIDHVLAAKAQVVAHGGRHVQAGAAVDVPFRYIVPEHILPVVRAEGAAISPLG